MSRESSRGFTLVEALVGLVVGAITLAGAFRLWKTHNEETYRLQKKTELRDQMTLSSKRIQRSITLAGLGLSKAPTLIKSDAVGSDTLLIYTNESELHTGVQSDLATGQFAIYVDNVSPFLGARYMAVSDGVSGEVKAIDRINGNVIVLSHPLESAYLRAATSAYPAQREKYFTDQDSARLIRSVDGSPRVLAEDIRNFQVSFRDRTGASTEETSMVRTVLFSFTGQFPAREGALNSMVFTSTAIPRNML